MVVPASSLFFVGIADDDRITAFGLFLEAFAAVNAKIERELEAVAGLRTHCTEVRVLGSYPRERQVD